MKEFNITGTCYPHLHYMVDTSDKQKKIFDMISKGEYFNINRPRQYGKSTTMYLLQQLLLKTDEFIPIKISFEGLGDTPFLSPSEFAPCFLRLISKDKIIKSKGYSELFMSASKNSATFEALSDSISEIIEKINKKLVIMIDEVDKSSNNQLFLHFLGMLRDKYLVREEGYATFHSVILAGVHDVKTLKLKLRKEEETRLNSPWNIAIDFKVEMRFDPTEIATMIEQYKAETKNNMDTLLISERLYFWTSGYPFLVSKLCKLIDEELHSKSENKDWQSDDVDKAVKILLAESNTLFDDISKNLINDSDLSKFMKSLVIGAVEYTYSIATQHIMLAHTYGLIRKNGNEKVIIHNKIFEDFITTYFISIAEFDRVCGSINNVTQTFYIKPDGRLNIEMVLQKFQEVIKEKYTETKLLENDHFLEEDLRILFLVFLKPILNGIGFCFKEVKTGEEKRIDVIIVFKDEKLLVELKMWRGIEYHKKGLTQLKKYMELESVNKGYMLIMSKNKSKKYTDDHEDGVMMLWLCDWEIGKCIPTY